MTVSDLILELRQMPQNAEVYMVGDWDALDDGGNLTDLHRLIETTHQVRIVDDGMEWEDETDVLLGFE